MTTRIRLSILTLCAVLLVPSLALAQARTLTLGKGAVINAVMQNSVDSKTANVGDTVTMSVIPPFPDGYNDFTGATLRGEVIKVTRANQGINPELDFSVTSITMADGSSYPLDGVITSMTPKSENKNGLRVAAATLGGMLAGNALGKMIFHTNVGGVAGAAGGFMIANNRKADFAVNSGSNVGVTLTRALVVRRQSSHPDN